MASSESASGTVVSPKGTARRPSVVSTKKLPNTRTLHSTSWRRLQEAQGRVDPAALDREVKTCCFPPFGEYDGEVNAEGILEGYGTMLFDEGERYEGQWQEHKRHGIGTFFYRNGDVYRGQYQNGKRNGYGMLACTSTGLTYDGQFSASLRCDFGVESDDKEMYMGEWKDDQRHGIGLLVNLLTNNWSLVSYVNGSLSLALHAQDNPELKDNPILMQAVDNRDPSRFKEALDQGKFSPGDWGFPFVLVATTTPSLNKASGLVRKRVWFPFGEYEGYVGASSGLLEKEGIIKFRGGSLYVGQFRNNQKHGLGTLLYSKTAVSSYYGEFIRGKKHGFGIQCWINKQKYEGEWKDGRRSGWGRLTLRSGHIFEGPFLRDKQDGIGHAIRDGAHFLELWTRGVCQARVQFSSKDLPTADTHLWLPLLESDDSSAFKSAVASNTLDYSSCGLPVPSPRHQATSQSLMVEVCADDLGGLGLGEEDGKKRAFGDEDDGDRDENNDPSAQDLIANKQQHLIYSFGTYVGEVDSHGRLHGRGVMAFKDGERYEGEFLDDKRHGRGKYFYNDGSSYTGEYENGKRSGYGVHLLQNGEEYEGEWDEGRRCGWGIETIPGKPAYKGQWHSDVKHGIGIVVDPSNARWSLDIWEKGEMKDSRTIGFRDMMSAHPMWNSALRGHYDLVKQSLSDGSFLWDDWVNS
eukprot:TRINITY_DN5968_c0_g1_i1.p1 TRINITY_DN5968_c0_g1~~TRINITY_DN5968_c0_g1_i1.p1  ORF type:complete len:691 (+),score=132.26 TRINITY_DN5968_c0_g1_i1:200-2272(+)